MIKFIIQNETHADNFYELGRELLEYGWTKDSLTYVHLDEIYKQKTIPKGAEEFNLIVPKFKNEISFYRMNYIQRFKFMIENSLKISNLIESKDRIVVIGNDGAVQRKLVNKINNNNGKSFLLLDGIIAKNNGINSSLNFKKILFKIMEGINKSELAPSYRGHSNLTKIFVMHDFLKDILIDEGVETPIEAIVFPRHLKMINTVRKESKRKKNILYATSAYEWHGSLDKDQKQKDDILEFINYFGNKQTYKCRIRIHPRESKDKYFKINLPNNISLTTSETHPNKDLQWTDLLITAGSTMAFEAKMIGKDVLIYTKNFGVPSKGSILSKSVFVKSSSFNSIASILDKVGDQIDIRTDYKELIDEFII